MCTQADRLGNGTTIGTNLIVERKGARVGLLSTAGHGDALVMMRGNGCSARSCLQRARDRQARAAGRPGPGARGLRARRGRR
ncbi:MAG: hypothetical protein JOY78_17035 [Pseudonocardia sp.]|nr:hypothetical protein [Pseudonocardia sp.]